MAAAYDNHALALLMGQIAQRYRDGATLKLAGNRSSGPVIVKFRSVEEGKALPKVNEDIDPTRRSPARTSTGGTKTGGASATSRQQRDDDARSAVALKAAEKEFLWQDRLGLVGQGAFVLPLMKIGELEDCVYHVRRWLPFSLLDRVEGETGIRSSKDLFHLVHGIWTALCFLHQPRVGSPHGNLKLSNVLLDSQVEGTGQVYLTDPVLLPDASLAEARTKDFQRLGLMIWQLCNGSAQEVDLARAGSLVLQSRWSFLGSQENEWKMIARSLMAKDTYEQRAFDPAAARSAWLAPVTPPGFLFLPIPAPIEDAASPLVSGVVDDELGRLQGLLTQGGWATAIPALCKLRAEMREGGGGAREAEVLDTLSKAVASIPDSDSSEAALAALQAAAPHSGAAAYRMGMHLVETNPPAALASFVSAMQMDFMQAAVAVGKLYMNGGEGLPANSAQAAKYFENAIKEFNSLEAKFWLAVLILNKKCAGKPEEATRMLEEVAHSTGPCGVDAKILLGHCRAVGYGIAQDHALATHAFQMACDQSRAGGQPDGYALNNLAVCLVHGLGVEQEVKLALDLLEQAATVGCRGALNNQDRLPRRLYLH